MVDDFIESGHLDGLRRKQVVAIPGPPAKIPKFRHADPVYWLGPERGVISIDSGRPPVYLKNGVASWAIIARD